MENAKAANSKLKSVITIISVILAVIIVAGLITYNRLVDTGFFFRHSISIESENYKINNSMMSYFFRTQYNQYINSDYASYYSYMGLDTKATLKSQTYQKDADGKVKTWFDYFMNDITVPYVKQMLVLAEAAKADGMTLNDEDRAKIDEQIKVLEATAKSSGYTLNTYFKSVYGNAVSEKDVRECMEISILASNYAEKMIDSYSFTDDEISSYYTENPKDFQYFDALYYTFKSEDIKSEDESDTGTDTDEAAGPNVDGKNTDTDNSTDTSKDSSGTDTEDTKDDKDSEISEDKRQAKLYAEELAAITDENAFIEYVRNYLKDVKYNHGEEDDHDHDSDIDKDIVGMSLERQKYDESNDVSKWAFEEETKDHTVHTAYDDDKGEYSVYLLTKTPYREEYDAKNVRIISLSKDTYDGSKNVSPTEAYDKIRSDYEEKGSTEEAFAELAKTWSTDSLSSVGGLCENIGKGELGSKALDEWLFGSDTESAKAEAGKVEIFSADNGDDMYVVYYIGNGEVKWKSSVENTLTQNKYQDEYSALEDKYNPNLKVNNHELYKINY